MAAEFVSTDPLGWAAVSDRFPEESKRSLKVGAVEKEVAR